MLTWAERVILWNQYEILKYLNPSEERTYNISQEILSHGYEQFYPEIDKSIYQSTINSEISNEVMSILNLFRAIHNSCKTLNYTPASRLAAFEGFDGNDEPDHYQFAQFVRRTLGRWEELKDAPDNSHSNVLGHYRRMLEAWTRIGRIQDLSPPQIEEIAESR